MRKCWANKLGNCAKGITREHLISNSILPISIVVQGFSWCRDVPKEIGSGSFVSNFLCEEHNNQLSKTDSEILNFAKAFKNFDKTMTKIKKYGFSQKYTLYH
jgi:hypothetical protein